jgi:hypothetical protein
LPADFVTPANEDRKAQMFLCDLPGYSPPKGLEAFASVFRITGGNFRLFERLLTQIERITVINGLSQVNKVVVEAARENLVIGQA